MKILKANPESARECAEYLEAGEIIVYPTETVYGLGADATSASAVEKAFLAKRRDPRNVVSLAVGDVEAARKLAEFNDVAEAIAQSFLPGPVTLILRSKVNFKYAVSNGNIGIRVPDDGFFKELWECFGRPVTSTSANISGERDPVSADEIDGSLLGSVAAVVDGGRTKYARSSTVVDVSSGTLNIVREGAIPADRILSAAAPAEY
jgi:L-threonylcarbamoyladenylate synthase